jgi:hypothetical protein
MNPILHTAVEAVTEAMARSFDEIWCRPDAAEVMEAFLGGAISFVVRCNEILVVESSSHEPD